MYGGGEFALWRLGIYQQQQKERLAAHCGACGAVDLRRLPHCACCCRFCCCCATQVAAVVLLLKPGALLTWFACLPAGRPVVSAVVGKKRGGWRPWEVWPFYLVAGWRVVSSAVGRWGAGQENCALKKGLLFSDRQAVPSCSLASCGGAATCLLPEMRIGIYCLGRRVVWSYLPV
jgi:hypothetical protein